LHDNNIELLTDVQAETLPSDGMVMLTGQTRATTLTEGTGTQLSEINPLRRPVTGGFLVMLGIQGIRLVHRTANILCYNGRFCLHQPVCITTGMSYADHFRSLIMFQDMNASDRSTAECYWYGPQGSVQTDNVALAVGTCRHQNGR
jgi:hypothetical protein